MLGDKGRIPPRAEEVKSLKVHGFTNGVSGETEGSELCEIDRKGLTY